jgi:hypothetical protein
MRYFVFLLNFIVEPRFLGSDRLIDRVRVGTHPGVVHFWETQDLLRTCQ